MDRTIFRSKPLVAAVLLLFAVVLSGESIVQIDGQAQSEYAKAFQAGKKLYEDGEHKEAVIKLLQALTTAKEKSEIVEACFYLSLSYYGLGDGDNTQLYLKKLFEAQPEREIDARLFPSGYFTLFYRMKIEFAKPKPAKIEDKPKAEEKKAELEKKAQEEEKKPVAVGGKVEAASQIKKKGKFPWLIVGGLVVVTGVVLYLILNKKKDSGSTQGSISVASTPSGAKASLDGSDTGLTTPCTLSNVSAGAHIVKLTKDGYADSQQNVTVAAGQTATVNAALAANIIVVTSPAAGATWIIGTTNDIRWQVDFGALAEMRKAKSASRNRDRFGELPGRLEADEKPGGGTLRTNRSGRAGEQQDQQGEPKTLAADPRLPFSPASSLQTDASRGIVKVKIELYKAGALHSLIIAETANAGVFSWQVQGTSTDGSDYKIRVSCSTDSSIYGESATFTITTAASITVIAPAAGSTWGHGSTHDILWTSTASGNVKIELFKGTNAVQTIVADTPNDGIHSWTISPSLSGGSYYKIRISIVSNPSIFGESGIFQIESGLYEFVAKWGSYGSGDGQLNYPSGVTVDSAGVVCVVDGSNHRIQKFTSSGTFITKWGSLGSGMGQFNSPKGIAIDSSGWVYVGEIGNDRIQKFTSSGSYITQWGSEGSASGQFNNPMGMAVDGSGYIYVADEWNNRIQKFTSSGTFVTQWGGAGSSNGQFNMPTDVAVDGSGYVYVTDSSNNRIQKFTSSGTFVTQWGGAGSSNGQFNTPWGIAVDGSGNVFVVEIGNHRAQKFTSSGTFLGIWGSVGSGDGQFDYPSGIAADNSGNVYIADQRNYRIQKFRPRAAAPLLSFFRQVFGPSAIQGNRERN